MKKYNIIAKESLFIVICTVFILFFVPNVFASDIVTGTWHGGVGRGDNPTVYEYNGTYSYENGVLTFFGQGYVHSLDEQIPFKKDVTEIVFDEGIVGATMFLSAFSNLKTVYLPSTYNDENCELFLNSCEKFVVSEQNNSFCSDDGILYNKEKTKLILYPSKRKDKKWTIPSTLENLDIQNDLLEEVVLPNGIKNIYIKAENLKTINIPETVEEIYIYPYKQINSCIYKDGLYYLGNRDNSYLCLFGADEDISDINISKKTKIIATSSLVNLNNIKEIAIPNNVMSISGAAIQNCKNLETISIGNGVKSLPMRMVFLGSPKLKKITVSNSLKKVSDYCIFLGEDTLEGYSDIFDLDAHLYYIGTDDNPHHALICFRYDGMHYSKETLDLPKGTVTLATPCSYGYFETVKTVNIPKSLSYIASGIFSGSKDLTDVYYDGTRSDWDKIEICENNEPLLRANIHFMNDKYVISNETVTDTSFSCEINFDNTFARQPAKAIIAFYNGDQLVQTKIKDMTVKPGKNILNFDFEAKPYSRYKLMIWNSWNSIAPLI